MSNKLQVVTTQSTAVGAPITIGQAANAAASRHVFADYRQRKAASTLRAQGAALALFSQFLVDAGEWWSQDVTRQDFASFDDVQRQYVYNTMADDLMGDPLTWRVVTWGIVKGFVQWQFDHSFAMSSINSRLSHVKAYAKLANQAGVFEPGEYERLANVSGFGGQEAARANEKRDNTRRPSAKKAGPVLLTNEQANELMSGQPDTAQGRRDAVLCHLALKHGLRASELALVQVSDVVIARDKTGKATSGTMSFYRPKLAGTKYERGTHALMNGALKAIASYLDNDAPVIGPLLVGSRKGGKLTGQGITTRSISERIRALGQRIGVDGLTAHDCRHYAATKDGQDGKSQAFLMAKFGWTSAQTASRYTHIDGPVVVE